MSKPPGDDPIAAEIQAEINDHLATAAEHLQSQGLATDVARQKSQAKFGDPATIGRRCYWIKQGDALMFRTAVIVLLAMLCLALGFTTISSYRTQSQMAKEMTALAEQLKALAEKQSGVASTPGVPIDPKPLEITGKVFVGSPNKPAANASLALIDLKDASRVRSFRADSEGNFNSGPLGGGDYALLTDTSEKTADGASPWAVQSAPIAAYPGVVIPPQQIDIEHRFGGFALETTRPLPHLRVEGRYTIESRLLVRVLSPQDRKAVWTRNLRQPKTWPIYVANHPWGNNAFESGGFSGRRAENEAEREFYAVFSAEQLAAGLDGTIFRDTAGRFSPGEVAIAAAIITDVLPADYQRPSIDGLIKSVSSSRRGGSEPGMKRSVQFLNAPAAWNNTRLQLRKARNSESDGAATASKGSPSEQSAKSLIEFDSDDEFYWLTKGLGNVWLDHLQGVSPSETPPYPHVIWPKWLNLDMKSAVGVTAGKVTRLQIEVPSELIATIKELVEMSDMQQFSQVTLGDDSANSTLGSRNSKQRTPESRPDSPLFRPAKITVLGAEALQDTE